MQSLAGQARRRLEHHLQHSRTQLRTAVVTTQEISSQAAVSRSARRQQYVTIHRSHYQNGSTRSAVINVLNNIASKREAQQYLAQLSLVESEQSAVINVGGAILTDYLHELCASLRNLNQMGLLPVIIHGAGPQLDKMLKEAGIEPQYNEGIRITDCKTLGIVRNLFLEENLKLVEALESLGVRARPITSGVIKAEYKDKDTYKYVGEVNEVQTKSVKAAIADGYIPVLTCMAESSEGQVLNVNADKAAAELARALVPLKIIYLSEKGGIHDKETGQLIQVINLDEEYNVYMKKPWAIHGTRSKIRDIKTLLDVLPRSSSVAIIHPENLEKEIITRSGAGTLVRRGTKIQQVSAFGEFDMAKLKQIMVKERYNLYSMAAVDCYLESLKRRDFRAYYDDNMDAMAVVLPHVDGASSMAHLSALTMTRSAWLSEIADDVFRNLKRDFHKLAWTVKQDDEKLTWFSEKADGSIARRGDVLFWYGLDSPDAVRELMSEFVQHGHQMFGDVNLESQLHHAASAADRARARAGVARRAGLRQQTSSYHTSARRLQVDMQHVFAVEQRRTYTNTNPTCISCIKNKQTDYPLKLLMMMSLFRPALST